MTTLFMGPIFLGLFVMLVASKTNVIEVRYSFESPIEKTLAKITEAKALKEFTADLRLLDLLNVFRKEIVTLMANEHVEISLENSDSPLFSRKSLELSFYVSNGSQTNNASNENNHKEKPLDGLHENHIAKIKTADVATKKFLFKFLRGGQEHVDNLVRFRR